MSNISSLDTAVVSTTAAYTTDFVIINDWGTGFTANLVITNSGDEPFEWSQLDIDGSFTITHLWGGNIAGDEGDRYTVTAKTWNDRIAPGASITIGFNGQTADGTPPTLTTLTLQSVGTAPQVPPIPDPAPDSTTDSDPDNSSGPTPNDPTQPPTNPPDSVPISSPPSSSDGNTSTDLGADSPSLSQRGYTTEFVVKNDWGTGFTADLVITNLGNEPLEWSQITFDDSFTITDIWGGHVVNDEGDRYTLASVDWTDTITPDSSVTIGFNGQKANGTTVAIANVTVDGQGDSTPISDTEDNLTPNPVPNSDPLPPPIDAGDNPTPNPDPLPSPMPSPDPNPTTGPFNYGEALQKSFLFYEAQRSGNLDEADKRIDWRGGSALNDGADVGVDLSGGYYDAGDHVKFGLPMAHSMTMLSWGVAEYRDAYAQIGQLEEALEAIKWGTDYLLKAHVTDANGTKEFWGQVGNGHIDHSYWGSPETMTMERPAYKIDRQNPGTELAAETAASLAAASIVFRDTDSAYADELLANAKQLYEFADTYRGKYSDAIPDAASFYNSWSGYMDELVWGATWLYEATGEASYLQQAESIYQGEIGGLSTWTINWDDKSYGAATMLAQQTGKAAYKQDVEGWLDNWVEGRNGVQITNGGLRWLSPWGSNRYAANTAFIAGVYADTITDPNGKYSGLTQTTIDYLLGNNPRNASYMIGFGNNSPEQPHHRAASGTTNINAPGANDHILFGALVGGPDQPDDFAYQDSRSNYITNEVALDYNAGFTGALAAMVNDYGGNPLTEAELNALPGVSINGF